MRLESKFSLKTSLVRYDLRCSIETQCLLQSIILYTICRMAQQQWVTPVPKELGPTFVGPSQSTHEGASSSSTEAIAPAQCQTSRSNDFATEHANCFEGCYCDFCENLSKTLSCFLRHRSKEIGADSQGNVVGDRLLAVIKRRNKGLQNCTHADLERIVQRSIRSDGHARFQMQPSQDQHGTKVTWLFRAVDKAVATKHTPVSVPVMLHNQWAVSVTPQTPSPDCSLPNEATPSRLACGLACASDQSRIASLPDAAPTQAEPALHNECLLLRKEYSELQKIFAELVEQVEQQEKMLLEMRSELDEWWWWWYR